jgi:hypothetical protein
MHTPEQRQQFIATLAAFPDELTQLVNGLTDEQLTMHYLDGEWTVAQNVHHMVDAHINGVVRFKLILTEEIPPLKAYNQDLWAQFPDANDTDIEDSLVILRGLHRRWVKLLNNITDDQLNRVGIHSEDGEVTVDEFIKHYADHCDAHIDQITRTLAAGGY